MRTWVCAAGVLALSGFADPARAAVPQPDWAYSWRPELGFFDNGPTCLLNPPEDLAPGTLYFNFYWSARDGSVLWFNWRESKNPSLSFESESGESWALTVEPAKSGYDGRRALLGTAVAAGVMRSLELGHALTVVMSFDDRTTQRHRVSARGAQIGVPMFRACIKSVSEDPPRYLFQPGRPFLGSYKSGERCEFAQIIELDDIPVVVTLSANADGGEMLFERSISTRNPHGPFRKRKTPDRVDAQSLFGPRFDLVERFDFSVSAAQLDELAAGLSSGSKRRFGITSPDGEQSTLDFGGKLGKPFAAMFAACRLARFPPTTR